MKIVKANAGALTNFQVLDFLNSRGASKDTTRVIARIARSEYKVYDYLVETAAFTQTRENVTKFTDKCKDFKVAKAEILNIINLRPSSVVELIPMIEKPDDRVIDSDGDKILKLVQELLPPLPTAEIHKENDEEEAENGEQLERPCSFIKRCVSDSKEGKQFGRREENTAMRGEVSLRMNADED